MNREEEDRYSKSQIPRILEVFDDVVERYHDAIILVFSTLICLVLSGMFVLRQRIVRQENAHKNCKNNFEFDAAFGIGGTFAAVVEKQPVGRPVVFSENVPDSILDMMPQRKAELIRAEKIIARSLSGEQKSTEAEVQRQQLEAIYKLMMENQEKFGDASLDQIHSQAALYGR
ncbi:hypothetical protein BIW11_04768 [Tropilaelaps mercedesae]|uniref:Matrix-remodeling-associated protein 7 helical domain-containing protein n=1 Tax=Tropilaelaps mercedesae TaxID=418985 RepID=A0A1V9X1X3_9ACAR|nr:hypothetical protein BIW11_04768 [Tropilaelaps mercedesae]